jgi:hypothetical protein
MGKVFQVEARNTGVLWGLTGGLLISLLLFLILPFTQKLSGSNPKNLLLKVDVSLPPPPPPPPPPRFHAPQLQLTYSTVHVLLLAYIIYSSAVLFQFPQRFSKSRFHL